MTQLPISPDTLAVGSSDGGLTVVSKNEQLNQQMARLGMTGRGDIGRWSVFWNAFGTLAWNRLVRAFSLFAHLFEGAGLNLKGHLCGATLEGSKFLYTPLDLEGHVSRWLFGCCVSYHR
jgi:hypothetical protein